MNTSVVHVHPAGPLVALVGNPNCGKSTLFNALTGLKQKVGNYPGVTVEKKTGRFFGSHGEAMELLDLPGSYSVTLKLDGKTEATQTVNVAGNSEQTVTFSVVGDTAGTVEVDVNGRSSSFTSTLGMSVKRAI